MRQLTTLSLFLFLVLNLCSTDLFSKEKLNTVNNLFVVLDPMEPSCATCADGAIMSSVAGGIAPYIYNWSNGATTTDITNLAVGTYTLTVTDQFGCSTVESLALAFSGNNMPLTFNVATLATSCFGDNDGNAVAVANGGTMPYTYDWSTGDTLNTASNLIAGTYTATVTDAMGISAIDTFEIVEPAQLVVTAASMSGCTGPTSGSAMATVIGGVFPYSYAWSTGDSTATISGLSTGTFGVTVTDANGCVADYSDFLLQPSQLFVNPEPTAPSCFSNSDGFINASIWGGSAPFTFLWSDGQTVQTAIGLIPGSYTVTVTDALNCSVVGQVFLDAGNPLDIAVQGITTVSCVGSTDGALLVSAFGGSGSGYTFLWDNGDIGGFADSLSSGFHTVTVTDDNQCSHVDSVFVNSPLALGSFTFSSPVCAGANDGSVDVVPNGGTLPYTYLWSTGDSTQTVSGLPVGNYFVTITDANGCTTSNSIQVTINTNSFSGTASATPATCPNVGNGSVMASAAGGVAPYSYLWSTGSTDSTVIGLPAGTYTVTITDAFGCDAIQTATITVPAPIVANETIVNVGGCSGGSTGSITLNPTGGTSPYTYIWSDNSTGSSIGNLAVGSYSVDITDANNCLESYTFSVAAGGMDNPPTVITQDITVSLNANNVATITVNDIDAGTNDDCGLASTSIDIMQFDCSHVGTQTVTLTAIDNAGQTDIGTATVTIQDTLLPTVITQDITISLDATGMASISTMDVDNGSSDNCGINNMALDIMQFDCSHIGSNIVILTAADQSGNIQTGTANVTVEDNIPPVVVTNSPTIYLDAQGMATLTPADVVTITDNCNIDSTTINLGLTQFDCSSLGMNLVSIEIIDGNGNSSMMSSLVTVADTLPAMISCPSPVSAFSCDSTAVITYNPPTLVDNCDSTGMATLVSGLPSGSAFPIGTTTNTFSFTDPNGNTVTCSFDVTIFQGTIDIMLDSISQPTPGNNDGSIDITVTGANPLTYEWFLNGTLVSTDEDPTGLMAGLYEVIVTDANGCTQSMMVDFMTSVNDPELVKNIQVYPNPTSNQLFVNIDLPTIEDTEIHLFDMNGKLLLNRNISASQNQIELNVSNFANGIYILKIALGDDIVTKRVTVSR